MSDGSNRSAMAVVDLPSLSMTQSIATAGSGPALQVRSVVARTRQAMPGGQAQPGSIGARGPKGWRIPDSEPNRRSSGPP